MTAAEIKARMNQIMKRAHEITSDRIIGAGGWRPEDNLNALDAEYEWLQALLSRATA